MLDSEYYRHQAALTFQAASWVSLYPDKLKLLEAAQSLLRYADAIESEGVSATTHGRGADAAPCLRF